ncbi:phage associated protein [Neisseria gonorrhoeae]|uniref:Phage associated protein n=1 Tax=Neisseria gonorrhoeae TaxID=485 RepID=A0A378VU83_NEIGO|nr:phage associated protein [Neisseria gonorrhoeae]
MPWAVWALIAVVGFVGWKSYGMFQVYSKATDSRIEQEAQKESVVQTMTEQTASSETAPFEHSDNLKPEDFVPTLPEKPESKPIYNTVRQVKTFEQIAGCIDGGNQIAHAIQIKEHP